MTETIESVVTPIDQMQLAQQLVEQARAEGIELIGPGGLLTGLTKSVLETALEAEIGLPTRCWSRWLSGVPGRWRGFRGRAHGRRSV
jgi:hypothetical protein